MTVTRKRIENDRVEDKLEFTVDGSDLETHTDECNHPKIQHGICTVCGECLEEADFQAQPDFKEYVHKSRTIPIKYVVKNPERIYDDAIRKILIPLNLERRSAEVRRILHSTTFNSKLKSEDKVIVVVYHILKADGFPISSLDLLKYTSMTKWRLLKVHRDTFGFLKSSVEYLKGVFDRAKNFLVKKQREHHGTFEEFQKVAKIYTNSEPNALCLAYLFESGKVSNSLLKCNTEYDFHQVANIRRKLKKGEHLLEK